MGKRRRADGSEVQVPWYNYTTGFNVQPRPFEFDLRARGEGRRKMVEEEMRRVGGM